MKWQLPQPSDDDSASAADPSRRTRPHRPPQPAYVRLIQLITTGIATGDLLAGSRLPSERELAQRLGINRSTVQHAFAKLTEQGVLERRVGSGTRISPDKWGVTPSTRWHDYLATDRIHGPDPFIRHLEAARTRPGMIDLANSDIDGHLALPLPPITPSLTTIYEREGAPDVTGDEQLRHTLAERLSNGENTSLTDDRILVTSGAQQAYHLISQGLLRAGDAIAVESPSYFYQLSLFQAAGIRLYEVPLRAGGLDLDTLTAVYHQHRVRFLFVNPTGQNPTGATMSLAARKALLARCRALHLPIVEDDMLGILAAPVSAPTSPPSLYCLDPENVITIGTLSPLMGPRTRIGWLIAPAGVVRRLGQIRHLMESELSIFPQVVATQLLRQPDLERSIAAQCTQLKQRRTALTDALAPLAAHARISYEPPVDNYHLWVSLNTRRPLKTADYDVFLRNGLLVRPGFLFGSRHNMVRLSFARLLPQQSRQVRSRMAATLDELTDGLESELDSEFAGRASG